MLAADRRRWAKLALGLVGGTLVYNVLFLPDEHVQIALEAFQKLKATG